MQTKTKIQIAISLLIGLVLVGPRVDKSYEPKTFNIGENVEQYLIDSESKFSDIRPNCEKKIQWFDDTQKSKTDYVIVYIHGYSATRKEIDPIPQLIAKSLNANLFYSRLSGHGRDVESLGKVSVSDWLNDSREALEISKKLGNKIIFMGTSTGATLATWLAAQPEGKDIYSLIYISPNFWPKDPTSSLALAPYGNYIVKLGVGEYREWTPRTEDIKKYWNYKTPYMAVVNLMGLVSVVSEIDVTKIETPLLILHSPKDTVISSEEIIKKYEKFGSKTKNRIEFNDSEDPNQHVLGGDIISPSTTKPIVDLIINFLQTIPK
jgi:esterase/lipase